MKYLGQISDALKTKVLPLFEDGAKIAIADANREKTRNNYFSVKLMVHPQLHSEDKKVVELAAVPSQYIDSTVEYCKTK
jgi:hypothetical protein